MLSLGAGTYSVKATKEGFRAAEQLSVELAANEIRKVDFGMKVSGVAETVNVGAQVEALETEQGRISSQITGAQLKELPIPNRNIVNLMALQPGVSGRSLGNELLGSDATPQFNANGMRSDGNSFTLDDSNINSISRGGRAEVTPNVETVAEVRVVTNNFSAEQGRNMGAQVSIVTKSGTNQFHGSAVGLSHQQRAAGPQHFRHHEQRSGQPPQPVRLWRGRPDHSQQDVFLHDLRRRPAIRSHRFHRHGGNAATAQLGAAEPAEFHRRVLHEQVLPGGRPHHQRTRCGLPTPGVNKFSSTPDGIPDIGTVQYLTTTDARSNQYTIRVDHELRPGKDRLYGYFYRLNARTITPGIRPDFLRPSPTWGTFGNLVYSRTISPTALNEVRLAATRFIGHYCAPKDPKDPIGGGLVLPGHAEQAGAGHQHHRPRHRPRRECLPRRLLPHRVSVEGHVHHDPRQPRA